MSGLKICGGLISANCRFKLVKATICLTVFVFTGCSSARETSETTEDPIEVTTRPAPIETDEQRQQIYNSGTGGDARQIPKPNLNNQASETNRKKNIEEDVSNDPAITPNEVRPQIIKPRANTVPGR